MSSRTQLENVVCCNGIFCLGNNKSNILLPCKTISVEVFVSLVILETGYIDTVQTSVVHYYCIIEKSKIILYHVYIF
jgi:hypothetical protein